LVAIKLVNVKLSFSGVLKYLVGGLRREFGLSQGRNLYTKEQSHRHTADILPRTCGFRNHEFSIRAVEEIQVHALEA